MLKFPPVTGGAVQHVDVVHYDDLIDSYVLKVRRLPGVLGISKFGSVSTPGLSDIDLVVTVSEDGPWPDWDALSLRRHAVGHPAETVVAHDVFVWPEGVAKQAEAFFYVDQQTLLMGEPLGGTIDNDTKMRLQKLMTMDYLIHRFESLASILIARQVTLRSILLFISTLRHSCILAVEMGVLSEAEKAKNICDINSLRKSALKGKATQESLDHWPERLVELLWQLTISVGSALGLQNDSSVRWWSPNYRQVFINSSSASGVDLWKNSISAQTNRWPAKYVRIAPIPSIAFQHVRSYFQTNSNSSQFLTNHFAQMFSGKPTKTVCRARQLRAETVLRHWDFIKESGYHKTSGMGYLGVSTPFNKTIKKRALSKLAYFNALSLWNSHRQLPD